MPFAKLPKTNLRTDILPNSVAVFIMILHYKSVTNIGIPATRLQSQTVCTPCLNLMIVDVSNMSGGGKNPVTMRVRVLLKR